MTFTEAAVHELNAACGGDRIQVFQQGRCVDDWCLDLVTVTVGQPCAECGGVKR